MEGPGGYEGFLEIFWKNEWSRSCLREFTMKEAMVVCRSLGYDKPLQLIFKSSKYTGRGYQRNVTCTGDEESLLLCNNGEHKQNCSSQLYPYIKCGLNGKSICYIVSYFYLDCIAMSSLH